QHQVDFGGALFPLIQRPIEHRQRQLHHGGIDDQQRVLESEGFLLGVRRLVTSPQQLLEDGLEQLPGSMRIGISQGRSSRRPIQPEMPQLAFGGAQAPADLAQGMRLPQLTEQHRNQLRPAFEATGVALGLVFSDGSLKLQAREQLQQLGTNTAYLIQGGSLRSMRLVRSGTQAQNNRASALFFES